MNMLSTSIAAETALTRPPHSAPRPAAPKLTESPDDTAERTRSTMRQFIGETFYGVLMQQLQKGLNQHNPISGGRGEEVFRGEFNQVIVRRMAAVSNFPLADAAVDQILKNTPHSKIYSPQRAALAPMTSEGIRA